MSFIKGTPGIGFDTAVDIKFYGFVATILFSNLLMLSFGLVF